MIKRPLILLAPAPAAKVEGAATPPAATPPPAAPAAAAPAATPDAFKEIDAAFEAAGTSLTFPPEKPSEADPKPAGGDVKPPAATPPPSPEPKAATPPKEVVHTPKELRAEKDRIAGELATERAAKATLEAKIADYEKKGKDTEGLTALLAQRETELNKLQGELRALKQEASPAFKEKYDKPFDQAAKWAENVVKQTPKIDGIPADFNTDFAPLYRMPYNAAFQRAKEVFGDEMAPAIMQQVGTLQKLDFERREAFEEEKKGWAEKQKAEEGQLVVERENLFKAWKTANQELHDTRPSYQVPVDDKELNDACTKGEKLVDLQPKSVEQAVRKNAHVRWRAIMFEPNQLQIKRLTAQLAEKDALIATLKPGQPNSASSKTGNEAPSDDNLSWEDRAKKDLGAAMAGS